MVIRVVNTHIHASSIKALQDKTRAINSSTGSGRPRLNILRTDILIGALDKGVHAIFPRCFDRNARRGHIGKVSGAIARQLNSPRTDLRILGWILPANFVAQLVSKQYLYAREHELDSTRRCDLLPRSYCNCTWRRLDD